MDLYLARKRRKGKRNISIGSLPDLVALGSLFPRCLALSIFISRVGRKAGQLQGKKQTLFFLKFKFVWGPRSANARFLFKAKVRSRVSPIHTGECTRVLSIIIIIIIN